MLIDILYYNKKINPKNTIHEVSTLETLSALNTWAVSRGGTLLRT